MMNRLFLLAFLFAAFAFSTVAQNNLKIGSQAPEFSGTLLDGNAVSLEGLPRQSCRHHILDYSLHDMPP